MFCKSCGNAIKEGSNFCTTCGRDIQSLQVSKGNRFLTKKKIILFLIFVALALISLALFIYIRESKKVVSTVDVAAAVVSVRCEDSEGFSWSGSGTIFSEDGLVLTNYHVISGDYPNTITSCFVILPDPIDGSAKEIYYANPIIIPNLSEEYDIAFLQIHDVFYDYEEGRAYGEYPKVFPSYVRGENCESSPKLGESIRVYGYPGISGGYALTITDGVISSFLPESGLIFTSAKISYGNSGGLAIDQSGCIVGIPSMVNGDENESLGIIISTKLISEFVDQAVALEDE